VSKDKSNIGIKVEAAQRPSIKEYREGLIAILRAGFQHHSDQETIRKAIDAYEGCLAANVTVNGCTITQGSNE
jgi:hypothetical protein